MNRLKSFVLGVLRIAAAILVVIIALTALGWGGYAFWQSRQAAGNAPLNEPKKWPPIKIEALGDVELSLSTMWRDGSLYYHLSTGGYPKELAAARDRATGRSSLDAGPEWTLAFLDNHGFKVFEHKIPLIQMAKIVDGRGQGAGLSANEDTYINADVYRRASSWEVTWNFGTPRPPAELPPPRSPGRPGSVGAPGGIPRPNWRNVSLWRGLFKGMSKEGVRGLLGEPGKVEESGGALTFWYYGYPSGGSVTFDRDSNGSVWGWSEP